MNEDKIVKIADVEQEFMAAASVEALKNADIAAYYKAQSDHGVLGLPGAYGIPDAFDIFVNEEDIEKAREILIGIGTIEPEYKEPETDGEDKSDEDIDRQPQTLAELFPDNPWLAAVYKVLLAAIVLAFLIGFVWLCDTVIAWVMSLFK